MLKIFPDHWNGWQKGAVILLGVVLVFWGLSMASDEGQPPDGKAGAGNLSVSRANATARQPSTYEVRYILKTSSAQNVRVVYNNATEGVERRESMPLSGYNPAEWRYQMAYGTFAYISVDTPKNTPQSVSVSCEILVNGQRKDYTEAKGPLASVTCSGLVGR